MMRSWRLIGALLATALLAATLIGFPEAVAASGQTADQGTTSAAPSAPTQPIAFSHKVHAGTMKLACKMCHPSPDPGDAMTIASASNCMKCHSAIKTDSPEIHKLAEYAKSGTPVPWAPVYQLPSFVDFSHKTHLDKGTACQDCHGQVSARDQLFRETNLSMAGCVDCHQAKKATTDCAACHQLPN